MIELLFKKKNFYPDEYKKTVFDINFERLRELGIKNIFIDLDNTLIPYDLNVADDKTYDLFKKLHNLKFHVFIISNNKKGRVKLFADTVKSRYVYSAQKPFKSGFRRALKKVGYPDSKTVCLIGDQFMTDVLGGKRMGFYVIVVDAIKRKTEKWYTKYNRHLEKKILQRLRRTDREFYDKLNLQEKR
ncbi:MAG: YqeG family HAD IIIA-type phosphatase [Candidatus Izemoplasmatales bacterium]